MKDYVETVTGFRTTVGKDLSGHNNPPLDNYDRVNVPNARYVGLNVSNSTNGDRSNPNPFSFGKTTWQIYHGSEIIDSYGNVFNPNGGSYGKIATSRTSGSFDQPPLPLTAGPDLSYNICIDRLYEQMRGNLDLSVSLAEYSQVFRMLKQSTKLARYVIGFHPKHWAKHWLEYKFGWYPLVSDIFGIAKEIGYQAPQLQRFKARATVKNQKRVVTSSQHHVETRWITESQRTEIGVVYSPSQSTLDTLSRYASLNPASIAWELLPGSFIVDYVYDVGSYLRSLESSLVLTGGFHSGYVTSTSLVRTDGRLAGNGKKVSETVITGSREGFYEVKIMSRRILTGLPKPMVPRFNTSLGANQLFTVAAVLSNFLNTDGKRVPEARRITAEKLDKQLRNFARGPRKWNGWDAYYR